jgi:RNA polymerase sigma factor (sigma-70 family)
MSATTIHPAPCLVGLRPLWYKPARMADERPEEQLKASFLAEEPEAVEAVRGWVRAVVLGGWRLHDPDAAVQEIMLELLALGRAGRLDNPRRFRALVRTVARNTCVDLYRRRRFRASHEEPGLETLDHVSAGESSAEDRLIEKRKRSLARYVLQSLSDDCRELLKLVFAQELGARQVGEKLGISEGNVRVRTHRCLERARALRARFWADA